MLAGEGRIRRSRVTRLIDTQLAAAGQRNLRQHAPALILRLTAGDAAIHHIGDERLDVVAHEVDLMHVVLSGRVYSHLGWRQPEDEPSVTDIDAGKLEDVTQESAVRFRVGTINDRVRADNHLDAGFPLSMFA